MSDQFGQPIISKDAPRFLARRVTELNDENAELKARVSELEADLGESEERAERWNRCLQECWPLFPAEPVPGVEVNACVDVLVLTTLRHYMEELKGARGRVAELERELAVRKGVRYPDYRPRPDDQCVQVWTYWRNECESGRYQWITRNRCSLVGGEYWRVLDTSDPTEAKDTPADGTPTNVE